MYNLSQINGSSIVGVVQGVNVVLMEGWLGTLWLIVIFIVVFLSVIFSSNDVGKASVASLFLVSLCAVLLRALELVPNITLFVTLVFFALSVALTWQRE